MATRVTSTKPAEKGTRITGGPKFPGPNGKGPSGNGHGEKDGDRRKFSPAAYRITMWVVLAAIIMMFAALSSAYIILSAGEQWRPVKMPNMFFFSTAIILLSSISLEISKRSLKQGKSVLYVRWLGLTCFLGLIFLTAQLFGWRELAAQGVYFAGHPHSSFFYFFTGVHGVHLLGGIIALFYLLRKATGNGEQLLFEKALVSAAVVSLYWHTMDVIWIWLFLLLLIWK